MNVLMNGFSLNKSRGGDEYLHDYAIATLIQGRFSLICRRFLIDLMRFTKGEAELSDELEKWMYLFKNMSSMEKPPVNIGNPVFEKFLQIAEYSKLNNKEKVMYEKT